jgi:IPT/TIG domain
MDAKIVSLWGAIIVSVVTLLTFSGALIVAFYIRDTTLGGPLLQLIVGAAIANATTAVGFWLGSSSGSQKKDEVIGAALRAASGAAPAVTGISPKSGGVGGGTTVTVTGSGFTNATLVQFGGINASTMAFASDTQITATSPPGAAGAVDVTVTTPAGTSAASLADKFTYLLAQN